MPYMIKKGFTLIEMVLTLMIISSLLVVSLKRETKLNLKWISFSNEYLTKQVDSLCNKRENELNDYIDNYYVHFNEMGRVNKAQTINFNNKKVIIHLGNGYLTNE